jgi:FMN phosphatase YigB (HAD superfamily)
VPEVKALLFWLGGVLTESMADLTLSVLKPGVSGAERLAWKQTIDPFLVQLTLGELNSSAFWREAGRACSSGISPEQALVEISTLARVRPEVLEIIGRIPERYQLWLISEFPSDWVEKMAEEGIFTEVFPPARIIFTADLGLKQVQPDIFQALPRAAGQSMSDCLVIDGVSRRAVAGIKLGQNSIIYVYPERLAHELALQKIIEGGVDIMHPAASERVELL